MHLMPRDAVRPMVRAARAAGFDVAGEESLDLLTRFCESLLPLPPFLVWEADRLENPDAHLIDLDDAPGAPTAQAPATVEVRPVSYRGEPWLAHLMSFRDGSGWRGFIAFREVDSGRVHRTAMIFQEADPSDLRDRFNAFENASLEAFLRSTLP